MILKASNKDFKCLFEDIICKKVAHVLKEDGDYHRANQYNKY